MRPTPRRVALALAVATSLALLTTPALAAWQPGGTRVTPVPSEYDSYYLLGATSDGTGGTILTWQHETNVPSAQFLYERIETQRIDRDGNPGPGWPAAGRTLVAWDPMSLSWLYSAGVIGAPSDGAQGAFVVTLQQGLVGDFIAYAQAFHITLDGNVTVLGPTAYGLLNAKQAAVDADGAGGLVFASVGLGSAPPPDPRPVLPLVASRFDGSGSPLWSEVVIAPPGAAREPAGFAVSADGGGGSFVAWVDLRNFAGAVQSHDLHVQHVRGDGTVDPAWPAGGMRVSGSLTEPVRPRLHADGSGGVWATWCQDSVSSSQVRVSHLGTDGSLVAGVPADGRVIGEMNSMGDLLDVRADGAGGLYVLRATFGDLAARQVVLHRLAEDGQPRPGWPIEGLALDPRPLGTFYSSGALAVDDAHGAFAAYQVLGSTPNATDVLVRELDSAGQPSPGWTTNGQPIASTGGSYGTTSATRSDAGVIVAWNDVRHMTRGWGTTVYAQRVLTDGPVATTASLVSAAADADGVHLAWQVALDGASDLAIERGDASGAWRELARLAVGADGRVAFVDADAPAGTRVGYRLAWTAGGGRATSEPAWVDVPAGGVFALGVGPNPASREGHVRFTLPHAGRAEVTVHDVTGRRVRTLARGAFAAGTHAVSWDLRDDAGRTLGAGVYLVRVASEEGTLTRKLAVAP